MAFILALIYFLLCVLNLIYNVFIEKYQSGLEAPMVMGITAKCVANYCGRSFPANCSGQ